ncbi:MAG: DUF2628 domain-containing protein [Oscillospiraceae bacterium]|nr:DUF2628 domain-containing protein [Oscillospiraceae bacterium]
MRYEKEDCAVCGVTFADPNEDIVVCPVCGAPMHRACWQANQCPHKHEHGTFFWHPTQISDAEKSDAQLGVICATCGANNPKDTTVCVNCHNSIETRQISERAHDMRLTQQPTPYTLDGRPLDAADTIDGATIADIAAHIRSPFAIAQRYIKSFAQKRTFSWNWAAFVFGPYWYFYRKLLKPGLVFAAIILICSLAFAPWANNFLSGYETSAAPIMAQINEAFQDSETTDAVLRTLFAQLNASVVKLLRANRLYLAMGALVFLLQHVAAALFADTLLRRKVWSDIRRSYRFESDLRLERPSHEHSDFRKYLLMRSGGRSMLAPIAYMWISAYLPGMIISLIELFAR